MGILGYRPTDGSIGRRGPAPEQYRIPGEPREKGREACLKVDRARRALEDLKRIFGDDTS
jgi:hypothetical protein